MPPERSNPPHFRLVRAWLLACLAVVALSLQGFAQTVATPESQLAAAFNEAMSAFGAGDYAGAVPKLEAIVAHAPKEAQIEAVYFTLGAAYFNIEQYPQATQTLRKYVQLYPQGSRLVDAVYFLGLAAFRTNDYVEAAAQFSKLINVPALREQALFFNGLALKESRHTDQAIKTLETLISPEIHSAMGVKAAMLLAGLYGEKNDVAKANAAVSKILQKTEFVENLLQLNGMAIELGDRYLQEGRPMDALTAYRMVRTHDQVLRYQEERVQTLERRFQQTLAAMRANPKDALSYLNAIQEAKSNALEARKTLEDAKQAPEFMPGVLLRVGRAYYDMGRRWESAVAYEELVRRYPEAQEREPALFGTMVNLAELNRPGSAQKRGEDYLKEFPKGPNAATVGYLMGATALQANDPQGAEGYFGRMLSEQPDSRFKAEIVFLLGNAKFAQGKFEEAIQDYQRYHDEFPDGTHTEDVAYRVAAGMVFAGQYEKAIPVLESYLQKFAKGTYAPDVSYRLALCYYAASQYDETVSRCRTWEKEYGADPQLGEVLALLADSLMAQGGNNEAIETYVRSYKAATSDEVLNYSLFEAQKALQKKGDWPRISAIFEEFVKDHPGHSLVPMAMYWIAKAKVREGKVEEAREYCAGTIKNYIDDPKRDAVELLLTQLAQLCARKPQPALKPEIKDGVSPAVPEPSTPSTPSSEIDPVTQLDRLLRAGETPSTTAEARILFAQSELAQALRKPDEQKKWLAAIGSGFSPEVLSPMLLARAGDSLLEAGAVEKAQTFFRYLLETYPKSAVADFASNGLGEIAYRNKDFIQALRLFSAPIDSGSANQKLKELTLGRAKTLLALDRLDEAQKGFEQVASVREWRGEATAQAVYSLGEIEFHRGKWPEANAFYQRVFVAYQKFLPWVARAYLQSGECFQKMGKRQEAARTYQEMLHNEKLSKFEETLEAKTRLQGLIGGQQG